MVFGSSPVLFGDVTGGGLSQMVCAARSCAFAGRARSL